MTEITSVDLVAFAVEVVVLTSCAVTLLGTMVAYRRHVLYRTGVRWLAASLVLVTAGALIGLWGLLVGGDRLAVVAMLVYTASSAATVLSMWTFARGFIELGHADDVAGGSTAGQSADTLSVALPAGERGFEDAGE